ncbi:carbohydrate binding-domain-containing protein [Roridomyces roridus]|uniref:Carbohydrate binding-domain-containing protein n=1 Tax=Roridomyces roridus TaxID=1738132 RepID=A0AAD7BJ40_9AGAR|nr:carbohydrate binding-domain-containing protein [Roridomyces roridus]
MPHLLALALTTFVSLSVVGAETLMNCGSSMYFPSQYTCFDDNFLCPIVNNEVYVRCGPACYSVKQYTCSSNTLQPYVSGQPTTLEKCGSTQFDPAKNVCLDNSQLCPIMQGNVTLFCYGAGTCYSPYQSGCALGQIYPLGTPAPTCVGLDGTNPICDPTECLEVACCKGLINIADKCRDPCDFGGC